MRTSSRPQPSVFWPATFRMAVLLLEVLVEGSVLRQDPRGPSGEELALGSSGVNVAAAATPTRIVYGVDDQRKDEEKDKLILDKAYQRKRTGPRVRYRGLGGVVDAATGGLQNVLGTVSDVNEEGFFGFRGGVGNIINSLIRLMNTGVDMASLVVHSILDGRDLFASRRADSPFKYDEPFDA